MGTQDYQQVVADSVPTICIKAAKAGGKILGEDDSPFSVLKSDSICDYPFKELAEFTKSSRCVPDGHQGHEEQQSSVVASQRYSY
ncbi:mannose-1-phosphate guanyltransferase [Penicillium capsulatum]|nr:mannose-1-phosphate guanyltransferase [Penicillium capsulatum]